MKRWVANIAAKVAMTSKFRHWRHGAIIEKSGRVISRGVNSLKPIAPQDNKYSTHAEAAAIRNAGKHTKGATIYSARVACNRLGNAKPCKKCELLIRLAGIKEVVYSIDNKTWEVYYP